MRFRRALEHQEASTLALADAFQSLPAEQQAALEPAMAKAFAKAAPPAHDNNKSPYPSRQAVVRRLEANVRIVRGMAQPGEAPRWSYFEHVKGPYGALLTIHGKDLTADEISDVIEQYFEIARKELGEENAA